MAGVNWPFCQLYISAAFTNFPRIALFYPLDKIVPISGIRPISEKSNCLV